MHDQMQFLFPRMKAVPHRVFCDDCSTWVAFILVHAYGAWQRARKRAGLSHVRVHDLKHTFGRRLRAAGVSFEDRQDLLGHRSGRITTHYSGAELENLYLAANKACCRQQSGVAVALWRPTGSKVNHAEQTGKLLVFIDYAVCHQLPQKSRKGLLLGDGK